MTFTFSKFDFLTNFFILPKVRIAARNNAQTRPAQPIQLGSLRQPESGRRPGNLYAQQPVFHRTVAI